MTFAPAVVPPPTLSARPVYIACNEQGGLAVRRDRSKGLWPDADELRAAGGDPAQAHYLGKLDGEDCYALALPVLDRSAGQSPGAALEMQNLRKLCMQDETVFAVAGRAVQVVGWADTHRFCGRCAVATEPHPTERCMLCPKCGLACYPRISPAIIVLVRRGAEALLARAPRLPSGYFSTLAGFVEVGESPEETVVREVREEVGLEVVRPRYFGSQPWPFPHSLMLGFMAEYASGEIQIDGEEISCAKWFRADALPLIPPRLSIARGLIDAWVAEAGAQSPR